MVGLKPYLRNLFERTTIIEIPTTMTNLLISQEQEQSLQEQKLPSPATTYSLKWRQRKLLVSISQKLQQSSVSLFGTEYDPWLVECLRNSTVELIRIDADLYEETHIKTWADICLQADKPLFLNLPFTVEMPSKQHPFGWGLKRLFDLVAASILLVVLSPIMLGLALLIRTYSPGPILFKQWRVGERGKLFRIYKFRTMAVNAEEIHHQVMGSQKGLHKHKDDPRVTPLGRWMRKYSLDELPQLFNVLRGEMSLVGPRPWAIYDAVRIPVNGRRRLNALPGVTGAWQVKARSTMLDLETVNEFDLEYLRNWSVWEDLKILLMTIPKVLSGVGAY